jgi:hypothetical protein
MQGADFREFSFPGVACIGKASAVREFEPAEAHLGSVRLSV